MVKTTATTMAITLPSRRLVAIPVSEVHSACLAIFRGVCGSWLDVVGVVGEGLEEVGG